MTSQETRICEKCLKECPKGVWNKTDRGRGQGIYWNVCTPCWDYLLEDAHNRYKKPYIIEEIKKEKVQPLIKELGRFHKLFGRFYIKL